MPKNPKPDSKASADKRSLNTGSGGTPGAAGGGSAKKSDRNQMQESRETGQFTGRGKPALQKK